MWNLVLFEAQLSFVGEGFVGIKVVWKGMIIYFVNVYSSFVFQSKRIMWVELINLKSSLPLGNWCVGGDFNAINRTSERKGLRAQFNHSKMQGFAKFIGDMDLWIYRHLGTNSLVSIWLGIQ